MSGHLYVRKLFCQSSHFKFQFSKMRMFLILALVIVQSFALPSKGTMGTMPTKGMETKGTWTTGGTMGTWGTMPTKGMETKGTMGTFPTKGMETKGTWSV